MGWRAALYVFAALVTGAHFLREAHLLGIVLCACAPALLLHRRRWVLATLQVLAYSATAVWVTVGVHLVHERQAEGRNWTLAAAIISATALVTLAAGLLLNGRAVRERYPT